MLLHLFRTAWITHKAIDELFGVKAPSISKHLSNIFESEELKREVLISILVAVHKKGKYISDFDNEIKQIKAKQIYVEGFSSRYFSIDAILFLLLSISYSR
jgi:hypothetical protein